MAKNYHKLKKDESRETDGKPVYLTEAGIERLHTELARLKERLPELARETQRTAEYGDRSDNAEYKQAKGALRRAHYRIFEIETKLKYAVAIHAGPGTSGIVQLGSTVVLEKVEADGARANGGVKTFAIVGPDETDPARGRISYLSPLGVALLGHKKDDMVRGYRIAEIT